MTRPTRQIRQIRRPTDEENMEAPLVPIIDAPTERFARTERTRRPTDEEDMDAPLVPVIDAPAGPADASGVRGELADLKSQLDRIEATLGANR
jgi:hypothetical protein